MTAAVATILSEGSCAFNAVFESSPEARGLMAFTGEAGVVEGADIEKRFRRG